MSAAGAEPDLGPAVAEWLADELGLPVVVVEARRLSGGSSRENWAVDAVIDGVARALLLRRDPKASVADTDRAVEVGVLRALAGTTVPAPVVLAADLDGTRLERPAVVMERSPGRTDRAMLRSRDPLDLGLSGRMAVARALPGLLAGVHRVEAAPLATFLAEPPADPAAAEIARWEAEIERVRLEPQPELALVALWLWEHRPAPPARVALVHGDFRPANVLVGGDASVTVLLDWEFAHLGDPAEDLGWYTSSIYRLEHFLDDAWGPADFLAAYEAAGGTVPTPERLRFWQVLAGFKLGAIALAGIHSFVSGTTDRAAAPAAGLLRRLVEDLSA